MNSSLREEIKEYVGSWLKLVPHPNIDDDEVTDEIITKFEKRIDVIRKQEEFNSYDMGWNMSLEKVKMEILK